MPICPFCCAEAPPFYVGDCPECGCSFKMASSEVIKGFTKPQVDAYIPYSDDEEVYHRQHNPDDYDYLDDSFQLVEGV
jgi:hypothetical protein